MSKLDFIAKNLINYYKAEFQSVWALEDGNNRAKIDVILKEFEHNKDLCNLVVVSYLNSPDLFTNFVGAYLSFAFGVDFSASVNVFKNIMRLYKNSPPNSLELKLYFYSQALTDTLDEQGYFMAFDGQKTTFTVPLSLIVELKSV